MTKKCTAVVMFRNQVLGRWTDPAWESEVHSMYPEAAMLMNKSGLVDLPERSFHRGIYSDFITILILSEIYFLNNNFGDILGIGKLKLIFASKFSKELQHFSHFQ